MASKNNPGKYDCYENAHPDEPMFVLLGRDPAAGALVRAWVDVREQRGEDPEKLEEARRCAVALDAWCVTVGKEPIALEIERDGTRAGLRRLESLIKGESEKVSARDLTIRHLRAELAALRAWSERAYRAMGETGGQLAGLCAIIRDFPGSPMFPEKTNGEPR